MTAALLATACVQEIPSDPVPTTAAPTTTEAPATTTTAAPTTTEAPATTTTTIPDDQTEPDESEFVFEQPATLMTEPGESIVVTLAGYEADGE
ncbi:MAG: cell wall anchor protein, partial [Actinobacteria bacterium]|nr:cell wall anchor protein [Actinomycetota bacterium]